MKTLKQIREEYDSRFVPPMEIPEELMLEGKIDTKSIVPSSREMPPLLLFRRITWRVYPNKQVVALYYSKLVDKYLSIPFGPRGNLNLSESRFYNSIEELDESITGAVTGAGIGYVTGGVKGAIVGAAKGLFDGGGDKPAEDDTKKKTTVINNTTVAPAQKKALFAKRGNTFKDASDSRLRRAQEKELAAQKKQIKENRVADLRKMVREGIEVKDLHINGRTVPLNRNMAKKIVEVYDSVNVVNKRKIDNMLNEDLESFKKLLNFSIKQ
jgi:hypothetical protein